MPETKTTMDSILKAIIQAIPKENSLVEGTIIEQRKNSIFVDIIPFGTGIIYGREYNNAKDAVKTLKIGDKITAKIIELENRIGYISLSLKEAHQDIIWKEIEEIQKNKITLKLSVVEANKGGLILEFKGNQGFLPTSQLRTNHYPRIKDGDKDKILEELQKMIDKEISVNIISFNPKERKIIFSEKNVETKEIKELIAKYETGDIIDGEVIGIVDFGIFLKIEEDLEGLVHISELDWSLVENLTNLFKLGQKVKAQIISIKDGKISLSIKALKLNPWLASENKYQKGDIVNGVVIRFNKHGALVSIEEGISGLVHISEFKSEDDMKKKIEIGKSYPFQITLFESKEQRLILNYLEKPE
jgi:ribosomal protein S1